MNIPDWLAEAVLTAQQAPFDRIAVFIAKARFCDPHLDQMSRRQGKAIERMLRQGQAGFVGGLSAENYISMTCTSRATATRDLNDLVEQGLMTLTGKRRHARYWLNLPDRNSPS